MNFRSTFLPLLILTLYISGCGGGAEGDAGAPVTTKISGTVKKGGQLLTTGDHHIFIQVDGNKEENTLTPNDKGEYSGTVTVGKAKLFVIPDAGHAELSAGTKTLEDVAIHTQEAKFKEGEEAKVNIEIP